jgi:Leucine-rich repeat (LRR) protein
MQEHLTHRLDNIDPAEVVRLVLAGQPPPASWIPHITELRLERARITDLRVLVALTSLRRLVLSHTLVSDIAPLAALTELR